MRSSSRVDLLIGALDACAEGAWIAVLYAAWQAAAAGAGAPLGLPAFVAGAALGVALGRRGGRRGAGILLLAIAAAAAGWLADPAARSAISAGDPGAFLLHPAGWLLGLATWRGTRHRAAVDDDLLLEPLLPRVLAALALPWLVGAAIAPPARDAFVAGGLAGTALFVTAGLAAIGLARLRSLAGDGAHPTAEGRWVLVVGIAVTVVLGATIPAGLVLGVSAGGIVDSLLGPIAEVPAALGRALADALHATGGPAWIPGNGGTPSPGGHLDTGGGLGLPGTLAVLGAGLAVLLGGIAFLVRGPAGRSSTRPPAPAVPETATLRRARLRPHLPVPTIHLPRPHRRPQPTTASAAYWMVVDAWADDPARTRQTGETPRSHAGRLVRAGAADGRLGLLAADFEREQYADRTVSRAETRRALRRARILVERRNR